MGIWVLIPFTMALSELKPEESQRPTRGPKAHQIYVGATLRLTALVELGLRAIRTICARKDLRRARFDIWLKSAFSWVHHTQPAPPWDDDNPLRANRWLRACKWWMGGQVLVGKGGVGTPTFNRPCSGKPHIWWELFTIP